MYICSCNEITHKQILDKIKEQNIKSLKELQKEINVSNCCGNCKDYVIKIIEENNNG